jgi:hypothetical protein
LSLKRIGRFLSIPNMSLVLLMRRAYLSGAAKPTGRRAGIACASRNPGDHGQC